MHCLPRSRVLLSAHTFCGPNYYVIILTIVVLLIKYYMLSSVLLCTPVVKIFHSCKKQCDRYSPETVLTGWLYLIVAASSRFPAVLSTTSYSPRTNITRIHICIYSVFLSRSFVFCGWCCVTKKNTLENIEEIYRMIVWGNEEAF